MSFWRDEVIDPMLDDQTRRAIAEQLDWIRRDPSDARPYRNLADLYRMQGRQDEALGLLLESARLDPDDARAQVGLCEIYAIREDYAAAWRHARAAEAAGSRTGVDLLERYGIGEPRSGADS
jgi:cytochrome c-type biogenesis protein CcmH/NrfG